MGALHSQAWHFMLYCQSMDDYFVVVVVVAVSLYYCLWLSDKQKQNVQFWSKSYMFSHWPCSVTLGGQIRRSQCMVVDIVVAVVAVGVVVLAGDVVDIAIEVEGSCPTLSLGRGLVDIGQVVGTEPAMGQARVDQLPHSRQLLDLTTYLSEQHFAVAIDAARSAFAVVSR